MRVKKIVPVLAGLRRRRNFKNRNVEHGAMRGPLSGVTETTMFA
jgi:hypothetical protein